MAVRAVAFGCEWTWPGVADPSDPSYLADCDMVEVDMVEACRRRDCIVPLQCGSHRHHCSAHQQAVYNHLIAMCKYVGEGEALM